MNVVPGDLVLVRSPGRIYAAGRWLTRNPYDHIAVVVSDGRTLNIDKPATRILPVERLLRPELAPLVLRPAWRSEADRLAFVAWMEGLEGTGYDVARTLALVPRLLLGRIGVTWRLRERGASRPRWICTDAVLAGLERHARGFDEVRGLGLDWLRIGAGTTNDFLRISRALPALLSEVSR